MVKKMRTIYQGASGEIVEKKSQFIATMAPINSQEAAENFIEATRKKYWDARHNCYAYIIEGNPPVLRCSDDGEPSQTAGKPMLDLLLAEDLKNVCVVVTRYFGGTLLGTGGLIRAYQGAVKEALQSCQIIDIMEGTIVEFATDYNYLGKLQYLLAEENVIVENIVYTDKVCIKTILTKEQQSKIINKITESTNGSVSVNIHQIIKFAKLDEKILYY